VNGDAVVRFREILASARDTVDPEQLVALARAAEEVLADDAVLIPIGSRVVVGAVWADKVSGFEMNTSAAGHTWNIEFWFRIDLQAVVG
jgi:ABC-type transport system substrate-binding protein